jgi:HK97 family phage major capsid protein
MTIKESIEAKKQELADAIDKAQELIDNPEATADDAAAAMDVVKQIEADIENLQALLEKQPEDPASTAADPASEAEDDSSSAADLGSESASEGSEANDPAEDDDQDKKKEGRSMPVKINPGSEVAATVEEKRDALNAFIHSRGTEQRDGIHISDVGAVIPEEIIYNPEDEVKTVTDLTEFVTKEKVTTGSGKYPILKKPSSKLPSTTELAKNPALANPEFAEVSWAVETYRGAIPVSQESIDDAAIDLTAAVARHIHQLKVNTTNAEIAAVLAGFTAAEIATEADLVDELKRIVNVKLDPAYNKQFVVTQSAYQHLDTLKDNDGRYLLQDAIGTASGKTLFGLPVAIVEDNSFGATNAGAEQMFIGDVRRAVLFADRADVAVRWVDNDVYGQILQAVVRFDVEKADDKAGYFVDITPTV